MYEFEYDLNKSKSNQQKHGIDFEDAQLLWQDSEVVELKSTFEGEERYLVIGRINSKCWTATYTFRSDKIRIISVRRSRTNEVLYYES
ncbi:MAG: BrnT family toxin [SAR324 cluster bacterium]|nr:BrnT family toxin [SAR324 cluster bacterium]MBL7034859.1 BrnT family toxin [SAR324 cluster bacterium]